MNRIAFQPLSSAQRRAVAQLQNPTQRRAVELLRCMALRQRVRVLTSSLDEPGMWPGRTGYAMVCVHGNPSTSHVVLRVALDDDKVCGQIECPTFFFREYVDFTMHVWDAEDMHEDEAIQDCDCDEHGQPSPSLEHLHKYHFDVLFPPDKRKVYLYQITYADVDDAHREFWRRCALTLVAPLRRSVAYRRQNPLQRLACHPLFEPRVVLFILQMAWPAPTHCEQQQQPPDRPSDRPAKRRRIMS